MSRLNEKYERAYVEQAREDVAWERRQKELLDGERALMKDVKGWVVGRRRYFTQWEDKPNKVRWREALAARSALAEG